MGRLPRLLPGRRQALQVHGIDLFINLLQGVLDLGHFTRAGGNQVILGSKGDLRGDFRQIRRRLVDSQEKPAGDALQIEFHRHGVDIEIRGEFQFGPDEFLVRGYPDGADPAHLDPQIAHTGPGTNPCTDSLKKVT